MPIFEFKCDKCGTIKDKLVKRVDENTEFACDCDSKGTLKRNEAPTAAVLRFKGNWSGTTGRF